jgi:hypothetical protein
MLKSLTKLLSRPGAGAGVTGAAIVLQLAALRALASATETYVTFAGRELHMECSFRQHFGIPCPNCGMTRSVLLALQGDLGRAMRVNFAGPFLLFGVMLFALAMFFLMFYQRSHAGAVADGARRRVLVWSSAYGALFLAVLIGHWVWAIGF